MSDSNLRHRGMTCNDVLESRYTSSAGLDMDLLSDSQTQADARNKGFQVLKRASIADSLVQTAGYAVKRPLKCRSSQYWMLTSLACVLMAHHVRFVSVNSAGTSWRSWLHQPSLGLAWLIGVLPAFQDGENVLKHSCADELLLEIPLRRAASHTRTRRYAATQCQPQGHGSSQVCFIATFAIFVLLAVRFCGTQACSSS